MNLKNLDPKSEQIIVGGQYLLKQRLGEGSFGHVFSGVDQQTNQTVALKLESKRQNLDSTLLKEKEILCTLQDQSGFPKYIDSGKEQDYTYLVMNLFGNNLEKLFRHCQKRFSLKTVLMLADQMLTNLEALHQKGYLHRDIKPGNFCVGIDQDKNFLHLIDFGLSKKYLDLKGQHVAYKDNKGLIGTAKYASLNTHLGIEQSRRDDLESVGYLIIYFLQGTLPWQSVQAESKAQKHALIKEKKSNITLEELCKGLPEEVFLYFSYVRKMQFDDIPDYKYLKQIFQDLFAKNNFEFDYNYDWTQLSSRQGPIEKATMQTENAKVASSLGRKFQYRVGTIMEGSKGLDLCGQNKTWVLRPLLNKQRSLQEDSDIKTFFTSRKLNNVLNSERADSSRGFVAKNPEQIPSDDQKTTSSEAETSEIKVKQEIKSRLKDCLTQRVREKQSFTDRKR